MANVPGLNLQAPPFDLLDADGAARLAASVDVAWFAKDAVLLEAGTASDFAWQIVKGRVRASDARGGGHQHFSDYGPGEIIGAFAVIMGRARHRYVAESDCVCLAIPAATFRALCSANPRFAAWFHEGLAAKQHLLAEREQGSELTRLMLTRVGDAQLAPAVRVAAGTTLTDAVRRLREQRVDCLLVEDASGTDEALGIVTRTDLLDALALDGHAPAAAIAPLARRPLVALRGEDVLFNALVVMTGRGIERVAVREGSQVIGTLGMAEVLAHYASHSHLISLRLARATTLDEVAEAASGVTGLIRSLHAQGARITYLMELVSALNSRILSQVFAHVVPAEYHDRICLVVMGSEGRREQILRTDQDNALVLADGFRWDGLDAAMQRFSRTLEQIGYPPCPGGVMVSNPHWRLDQSQWLQRIEQWRQARDAQAQLDLAITIDARAVAGNAPLCEPIAEAIRALGHDDMLMRFMARSTLSFDTPLTLFGKLRSSDAGTDLKKGGIFPLVHGLRTLALRHQVHRNNSFGRSDGLARAGALPADLADQVRQALGVFQRLRLARQLEDLDAGRLPGNHVDVDAMRHLDRELLRDALRVVNAFKEHIRSAFQLER
ncbi:MAG: DUF294 nucleotidyltransferase-like domain-containing protein [Pseudoxanthomonas suwonensis]|nr:DUF294 nucleotidyltransferase-like domain-containing protein [Pseudoxanthomonas suwonensis]